MFCLELDQELFTVFGKITPLLATLLLVAETDSQVTPCPGLGTRLHQYFFESTSIEHLQMEMQTLL